MVKNVRKLVILLIAVVAIGTFALPSVLTASVGQHTFYPGSAVECTKCHTIDASSAGVGGEIYGSGNTDYGTVNNDVDNLNQYTSSGYTPAKKIHLEVGCEGCHTQAAGGTIPTDTHVGVSNNVVCVDCHVHVTNELAGQNGAVEVHADLANIGNSPCIGCHTAVAVSGSVSYGFTPGAQPIGTTGLVINAGSY